MPTKLLANASAMMIKWQVPSSLALEITDIDRLWQSLEQAVGERDAGQLILLAEVMHTFLDWRMRQSYTCDIV